MSAVRNIALGGFIISVLVLNTFGQVTNGGKCNLFDSPKRRECCMAHDTAYDIGGSFKQKWKADTELFKCVKKQNKIGAFFMFIGTSVGGLFTFQWHTKSKDVPVATEP